ncbi:DNA replication licensing factor, MCM3 component [Pseudoloma neurophilia]|uniref:DNA replication licensing factor, MCM3 component n=1 Tax=Pseudoloma neurophilia TaxID=146866 RepID=A0A0R0M791_9MICR|nr:DNA replication licensing factor, MCM3 component [Pseudoloma neurophilia]
MADSEIDFIPLFKKYVQDNYGIVPDFNLKPIDKRRITVSLDEMRVRNDILCQKILKDPIKVLPDVEAELQANISFIGAFGEHSHTPATLSADLLGKMVKVEGIITSVSNIKPKLKQSIHEQNNVFYSKDYRDATTLTPYTLTSSVIPKTYSNEPLNFEFGLSSYIDTQTATMQEMPENAKPGAMPRSIHVILYEDLTDSIKPGDRVILTGIYKAFCYNNTVFPNNLPTALIVNHVENKNIKKSIESKLKELSSGSKDGMSYKESILNQNNVLDHIAPFIYISNMIKKAILLQMIGSENDHCRKSINIMLLGDPSTAKSQMLRFVINTINAISTSGKGSTGVGLTASIVSERNERRLEAGAMVLADNSIICIDEFDKINYVDSVVLHEVMEQQSISINKAGIHVTLNARTAVLAAANPIYGNFTNDSLEKQIRIPDSLLSRFDLIFLVLDDNTYDSEIADRVLDNHSGTSQNKEQDLFELQKYIFECKKIKPTLLKTSAELIADFYVHLRSSKTRFPITPRLLDSMIRLSNANARFRKSLFVEEEDANEAISFVKHCYQVTEQSQFKRMKVEKSYNEPSTTQRTSLPSGSIQTVKDTIMAYRDENPDASYMILSDITHRCEIPLDEVISILNELDSEEILMFRGETIIFLS